MSDQYPTDEFTTPLLQATSFKQTQVVKALLSANADPNIVGKETSALRTAVSEGLSEIVTLLILVKANIVNPVDGPMLLDVACNKQYYGIVENIFL